MTAAVLYQMGLKMGSAMKIQRIVASLKVALLLYYACVFVVDCQ
jgi:hypothetical protein